jgi:hypothetical protein
MQRRAYRPEAPRCLEERSLLSGVAAPSLHPVVLLPRKLVKVDEHVQMAFQIFTRSRDFADLHDEIHDVQVLIPYQHVDGLGLTIRNILHEMQLGFAANAPHPIRSAQNAVLAAIRAEVVARIQTGDVILR